MRKIIISSLLSKGQKTVPVLRNIQSRKNNLRNLMFSFQDQYFI